MRVIFRNFHIIDETLDMTGSVVADNGIIIDILSCDAQLNENGAAMVIDGLNLKHTEVNSPSGLNTELPILMPAFVDLHAHFRDPGFPDKEVLESAALAAAAGGFGTVVCMANTNPVIDSLEKATMLKKRSDALGIIDLYPVISLTSGMEGKKLSEIASLTAPCPDLLMLSEDGKDIADDDLFLAAMAQAKRLGVPISCHCDFGGPEAEAAKKAGQPRRIWSRIEENNAVRRVIELGKKSGCHIHIAHVSTKEAVETIRKIKTELTSGTSIAHNDFKLTCEVMPHNICLTEEDAKKMSGHDLNSEETFGRVNPPLRTAEDCQALITAIHDNVIDAIATDHAPHSKTDKENGAPGFSGLETAFAASFTKLAMNSSSDTFPAIDLSRLSSLMSANPARLLNLNNEKNGKRKNRGLIKSGFLADLAIIDASSSWIVNPDEFFTRGKNSPFIGKKLFGKIIMTVREGRIVFMENNRITGGSK